MTDTLDFSGRAKGPLDFSNRARSTTPAPSAPSAAANQTFAGPRQRGLGERFTTVVDDAMRRNPIIAGARYLMGREADQVHTDPATGETFTYRSVGTQMREDERSRRDDYETMSRGDSWQQARGGAVGRGVAGATNIAGAITGAAADPTSVIGGPAKTLAGRIFGGMAVNAAGDVVTQAADVGADVQDQYSPLQTAASAAIGGVIQGGFEVAPHIGGAAARGGRQALDFSSRAVDQALDFSHRAAGAATQATTLRNPVPDFGSGAMDAGPLRVERQPPARSQVRQASAPPEIAGHIGRASRETGVSADYLTNLARRESSFNASVAAGTSSARGLYQFTEGTWLGTLRRHGAALGLPDIEARITRDPGAVLALRDDPALASRAAALLSRDNAGSLGRTLGREPTDAEIYTAHFLGEKGASRLAQADDGARAADLFPEAARSNRSIFFEGRGPNARARSIGEVRAQLGRGFDGSAGTIDGPSSLSRSRSDSDRFADGPLSSPMTGEMAPLAGGGRSAAETDAIRAAMDDPSRLADLRTLFEQRMSPREARSAARSAVHNARQTPAPESRLAAPLDFSSRAVRDMDIVQFQARPAENVLPGAPVHADARPAPDFSARATPETRLAIDMTGYESRIGQPDAPTVQSSGQSVSGLREAPRPGAIGRGQGAVYQGKTVSQLAQALRSSLGLTQRQGRVSMKQAAGEYDTGSGVIRTRAVDELDVISHEAFHAFEYEKQGPALAAALKANAPHLKTLAYPGAPTSVARQEGFAEFGRWYLTNPDHARRIAPDFYRAFEEALAQDAPDVLAKMQAIQAGYRNVLDSASIDVATGSIAYTGRKGTLPDLIDEMKRRGVGSTIQRIADDAYTAFVDDLHPLSVAVRKLTNLYVENTGQKLDLKRAADPYALARLSREAYAAGHSDLLHGVTPYRGIDPEGVSLADALETAGIATTRLGSMEAKATREFDAYLISRRMIHEWDRYTAGDLPNPPDRNTKQFHEQVIADADAAHPTWAAGAAQAYEFQNNLWRKEYEAGLITEASYRNGLDQHPDYVPLMRDMSDKGPGGAGTPRGALQFAGGVKAFEGSSRDIISPLSSIIRRSYELNAIIKRNDTLKALDDLAQSAGRGSGAIVERLPAKQIEAFTVQAADALQKTADEMGLTGRDLSTVQKLADDATNQDATITLFKQSEFSPRKGEAVVFVWRDGKKTPLLLADGEFGQQMFQALAGMNRDLQNVVVDTMAAMTQTLRYGVTLSPEFMAANIIRDQVATWINSDVGFVPLVDMVKGAGSVLRQDGNALRYANAGGMTGGANVAATRKPFPKTDAEAQAQLQMLRKKGYNVRRLVKGPWRALAELTDLSETSTRLGVFKRGFDQAKARGLSDYEALIESGFTSRDYLDFGRHGSKMISAARIVTFLNAQVQGMDKSLRVLTAGGNLKRVLVPMLKEVRTPAEQRALGHAYKAWAKIAALGAFGLGLRMLYADDPEYQEIGDQLRATNWIFRAGGQWVFIPKPFELATASNILERAYEGAVLKDPTAGKRLLSDFRNTIAPPHEIPALSVPFQIGANRDHLGRPIVPDHLRGAVDPALQFNAYTSDLGKLIGKTFKVSPSVVDHVVTGYGGSLGRYALQGSNLASEAVTGRPRTAAGPEDWFLSRRFIRDISRGSTSQAEFWNQVSRDGGKLTTAEGSFRALVKDGKDDEAVAYLNRLSPNARAFVTLKVFGGDGESLIHPLVRAQKALSVISDFRTDARDGELRDATGVVIPLSPHDRRIIDDSLSSFALAEMRNALVSSQTRGWAQKGTMDASVATDRIGRVNPAVLAELTARLELGKAPTILSPETNRALNATWAQIQPGLARPVDPARFVGAVRMKRGESGDRLARYQEAQRVAGGAYSPPAGMDFSSRSR